MDINDFIKRSVEGIELFYGDNKFLYIMKKMPQLGVLSKNTSMWGYTDSVPGLINLLMQYNLGVFSKMLQDKDPEVTTVAKSLIARHSYPSMRELETIVDIKHVDKFMRGPCVIDNVFLTEEGFHKVGDQTYLSTWFESTILKNVTERVFTGETSVGGLTPGDGTAFVGLFVQLLFYPSLIKEERKRYLVIINNKHNIMWFNRLLSEVSHCHICHVRKEYADTVRNVTLSMLDSAEFFVPSVLCFDIEDSIYVSKEHSAFVNDMMLEVEDRCCPVFTGGTMSNSELERICDQFNIDSVIRMDDNLPLIAFPALMEEDGEEAPPPPDLIVSANFLTRVFREVQVEIVRKTT